MKDIRKNFESWLIKQGLSLKTPKGRPGAVYEYLRYIDNVCDIVCLKHDNDAWQILASNIYLVLGFYLICKEGFVHIDSVNKPKYEYFVSEFLNHWGGEYRDNVQNYYIISSSYHDPQVKNKYLFIKTVILSFLACDKDYELDLSINLPKSVANNHRKALQKFYDFLKEKQYDPKSFSFLSKLSNEKRKTTRVYLNEHYLAISTGFKDLESHKNSTRPIFYLEINGGYYQRPPRLIHDKNDETISATKVMKLLQISDWSLRELNKSKQLCIATNDSYLVKDVDNYIKSCFVKSKTEDKGNPPNAPLIKVWWTASQIHNKYGITTRYITKLREEGKVSYIKVVNRKYLYFPYAFKKYAKSNKRFVRIRDKKI